MQQEKRIFGKVSEEDMRVLADLEEEERVLSIREKALHDARRVFN